MKISRCRSCNAEIVWMKTLAGKKIPVDLVLQDGQPLVGDPVWFEPKVHITHFATCPSAERHRKPKGDPT